MDLLADYLWPGDSTGAIVPSTTPTTQPQHRDEQTANPSDRTTLSLPTEFMLFLGDFVYADVPYYFGDNLDAYRRLYRRNYQSPSFRRVYERLRGLQVFTF
jgi:alkaline phosphatase D